MDNNFAQFLRLMNNPVKFRLFLLSKLPSAYFSGVRIEAISERHCITSVPFKWFTKNPFKSTYFACLAMAAEMSTGALAMGYLYKRSSRISMLVTSLQASYSRKATGTTFFACTDGEQFKRTIELAETTGEPQTLIATSVGRNREGDEVAVFNVTWSFRARANR